MNITAETKNKTQATIITDVLRHFLKVDSNFIPGRDKPIKNALDLTFFIDRGYINLAYKIQDITDKKGTTNIPQFF